MCLPSASGAGARGQQLDLGHRRVHHTCTLTTLEQRPGCDHDVDQVYCFTPIGVVCVVACVVPLAATIYFGIPSATVYGVLRHLHLARLDMVFGVATLVSLAGHCLEVLQKRSYSPELYHMVQEIQRYNIQDYRRAWNG